MRIIESMTRIPLPNNLVIRVWRQESGLTFNYNNQDIYDLCKNNSDSAEKLAEKICQLPRINAVEVLNAQGNGVLIYPDWP